MKTMENNEKNNQQPNESTMQKCQYIILQGFKKVVITGANQTNETKKTEPNDVFAKDNANTVRVIHDVHSSTQIFQPIKSKNAEETPAEIELMVSLDTRIYISNCGEVYVNDIDCKTLNITLDNAYAEINNVSALRFHCLLTNSLVSLSSLSTDFADIQIHEKTRLITDYLRVDTLLLTAKKTSVIILHGLEVNRVFETVHEDCIKILKGYRNRKKLTMQDVFKAVKNSPQY
jgi:hypothetical protein